jgi:hypothetical protein
MNWLYDRWQEPESRAAVAAALGTAAAYLTDKVSGQTLLLALFTAAAAFVFPSSRKPAIKALAWWLAPLALLGALSACGGGAQQTGIAVSQDAAAAATVTLSASDLAQMRQVCAAVQPDLAAATAAGAPKQVSAVAVYPQAFCAQLAAGGTPATANSGSPVWLGKTLGLLQTAAQLAGLALPLIAAL